MAPDTTTQGQAATTTCKDLQQCLYVQTTGHLAVATAPYTYPHSTHHHQYYRYLLICRRKIDALDTRTLLPWRLPACLFPFPFSLGPLFTCWNNSQTRTLWPTTSHLHHTSWETSILHQGSGDDYARRFPVTAGIQRAGRFSTTSVGVGHGKADLGVPLGGVLETVASALVVHHGLLDLLHHTTNRTNHKHTRQGEKF